MKYYGIKGDNYKNIVNDWEEAKKIISEIKNPKYKSFLSEEEAEAFINDVELSDGITEPKCYIDGSFNATNFIGSPVPMTIDNVLEMEKSGINLSIVIYN